MKNKSKSSNKYFYAGVSRLSCSPEQVVADSAPASFFVEA